MNWQNAISCGRWSASSVNESLNRDIAWVSSSGLSATPPSRSFHSRSRRRFFSSASASFADFFGGASPPPDGTDAAASASFSRSLARRWRCSWRARSSNVPIITWAISRRTFSRFFRFSSI